MKPIHTVLPIPSAVMHGEFTIFGVRLRCYVLDDGTRIIDADDLRALFEAMARPDCPELDQAELQAFATWSRTQ